MQADQRHLEQVGGAALNYGIDRVTAGFSNVARESRVDVRQVATVAVEGADFASIGRLLVNVSDPRRDARVGYGVGCQESFCSRSGTPSSSASP